MIMKQYKTILYELIFSLTLNDYMSGVADDIAEALRQMEDEFEWIDLDELREILEKRGINTLWR